MRKIWWILVMGVTVLTGFGLQATECIAHRGDSIRHPDNTVEAIQSGWEMGADVVEVDVRMTREGVLVLFHDADLNKRPIADMTHKELDAATPKYRVPTMKEGLLAAVSDKALLLDLKDEREEFLKQVLEQAEDSTIPGSRVMLQSTSLKVLGFLRQHAPNGTELFYVTNLKTRGEPSVAGELANALAEVGLQGVTAQGRQFVNKAYVAAFHKKGLKYYVWTINPPDRIQHYVGIGVDGIISDDPAAFRKVVPAEKP